MASEHRKQKIEKKTDKSCLPNLEKAIKAVEVVRGYCPNKAPISVPKDSALGKAYLENDSVPSLQWILDDIVDTLKDVEVGLKDLLTLSGEDTEWTP